MLKICRTCLQMIEDHNFINLNDGSTIRAKLGVCIPTMNPHLIPNPVMCLSCVNSLNLAYEFTSRCLQIEEYLCKHLDVFNMVEETREGTNLLMLHSLSNPTEQLKEEVPKTITPMSVFYNKDGNSESACTSATGKFKLGQTLITGKVSQNLTLSESLSTEIVPEKEGECAHSVKSSNKQIYLRECRVNATPLEVVIKKNSKRLLRSINNKPDSTSNNIEDALKTSKRQLIRECSVVVTPIEYFLLQNIKKYHYNEENSLEPIQN